MTGATWKSTKIEEITRLSEEKILDPTTIKVISKNIMIIVV